MESPLLNGQNIFNTSLLAKVKSGSILKGSICTAFRAENPWSKTSIEQLHWAANANFLNISQINDHKFEQKSKVSGARKKGYKENL